MLADFAEASRHLVPPPSELRRKRAPAGLVPPAALDLNLQPSRPETRMAGALPSTGGLDIRLSPRPQRQIGHCAWPGRWRRNGSRAISSSVNATLSARHARTSPPGPRGAAIGPRALTVGKHRVGPWAVTAELDRQHPAVSAVRHPDAVRRHTVVDETPYPPGSPLRVHVAHADAVRRLPSRAEILGAPPRRQN
jgi:hypothetical protein